MAVHGCLWHSGFTLAVQFEEGKGGIKQRPRRQTTTHFRGEKMKGQAGSSRLHSLIEQNAMLGNCYGRILMWRQKNREKKRVKVNTDWSGLHMEHRY